MGYRMTKYERFKQLMGSESPPAAICEELGINGRQLERMLKKFNKDIPGRMKQKALDLADQIMDDLKLASKAGNVSASTRVLEIAGIYTPTQKLEGKIEGPTGVIVMPAKAGMGQEIPLGDLDPESGLSVIPKGTTQEAPRPSRN